MDFVHPATPNDDPVVTLHSLLDRDVYRGGAIVVGPVRRGRGRRAAGGAPGGARHRRPGAPRAGLRARAVAHRRGAPELGRAAGVGDARGRARGVEQLAPGEGDAALRLTGELRRLFLLTCLRRNRNTQLRLRALSEVGGAARPRGVRRRRGDRGRLVARRAPRGREGAAPGAGRAPDRPPRPGRALALAPGRVHPRGARGVRGAALAGDQAPAGPARELRRRGPRAQRPPAGAGRAQAGPPPVGGAAGRRAGPHARGAAGAATARACGWPASRPRWRASCCATSRRASAAAAAGAGARRAAATPTRRTTESTQTDSRRGRRPRPDEDDGRAATARRATATSATTRPGRADADRLDAASAGPPRRRLRSGALARSRCADQHAEPPPSSIPAAVPSPPSQRTSRPSSASRRRQSARISSQRAPQPRVEAGQQGCQHGLRGASRSGSARRSEVAVARSSGGKSSCASSRSARCPAPPSPPAGAPPRGCPPACGRPPARRWAT